MSWGITLLGLEQTLDTLQALTFEFEDGAMYVAGPTVSYAIYQERGTSSIEARPFVRPAAERVEANLSSHIERVGGSQGLDLSSEEDLVRAAALAVQSEMQRIADRKDIRDTGALIASISIERVQ